MLDNLLRKTLENTPKEYKKNMIDSFRINIGKLINNINDYIEVEEKIYNAEKMQVILLLVLLFICQLTVILLS